MSRIQGLENDARKLVKELEAAKKSSQCVDSRQDSIEIQKKALQGDVEDLKKRCAMSGEAAAKLKAENKRLQAYVKKLEATQRLKDAQVQTIDTYAAPRLKVPLEA